MDKPNALHSLSGYSLLVILTTDTVVSLLLLAYSLAYPLCEESRERNKPIIRRTVAWSIVAISSTFVFLLSVLIFNSLPENRTNVNSLLVTMNIDILLNTLSINMTWDIRYYRKAIDWLCHFPSVQKKDNIKVDHDEKRAKISSVASLNGIAGSINLRDTLQDRSESVVWWYFWGRVHCCCRIGSLSGMDCQEITLLHTCWDHSSYSTLRPP